LTAGVLDICGAFGGKTFGENQWNKKGMFENREIRENVVKPFLFLNGVDPKGQNPLPDPTRLLQLENLATRVETIMKFQGYRNGPWYYKGAKLCLIWPTWHAAFPEARWIIVRRKDEDIVHSCMNTAFMNAYHTPSDWQEKWIDVHKLRFREMHEAGLDVVETWPEQMIQGDFTHIEKLVRSFGLPWKEDAVRDFIAPELWRSKHGTQSHTS
jgi:hypothetical protein